jgi:hypothetical protein
VFGGTGPNVFDCSELARWSAAQLGVSIPRVTYDQIRVLPQVAREQLAVGDLIFSHWGRNGPASHVAIYAGDNQVVHASSEAGVVTTRELNDSYWTHVDGIRRIPGIGAMKGTSPAAPLAPAGSNVGGTAAPVAAGQDDDGPSWWEFLPPVIAYEWLTGEGSGPGSAANQTVRSGLDGIGDAMRVGAAGLLQVGNLAQFMTKIFLPNNAIRVFAGASGIVFILIGIWFLAREMKSADEANPQTPLTPQGV